LLLSGCLHSIVNFDGLDHSVSLTFFGCLQSLQRERCKSVERSCIKHNFRVLVEERVQLIFHWGAKAKVGTASALRT
jgi:hypothetical protein